MWLKPPDPDCLVWNFRTTSLAVRQLVLLARRLKIPLVPGTVPLFPTHNWRNSADGLGEAAAGPDTPIARMTSAAIVAGTFLFPILHTSIRLVRKIWSG